MMESSGADAATLAVQIFTAMLVRLPVILACAVLGIALMIKIGREKGAIVGLLGVMCLGLLQIVGPVIYTAVLPQMIVEMTIDQHAQMYQAANLLMSILQAGALLLIAVGTFMRPAPGASTPPSVPEN